MEEKGGGGVGGVPIKSPPLETINKGELEGEKKGKEAHNPFYLTNLSMRGKKEKEKSHQPF